MNGKDLLIVKNRAAEQTANEFAANLEDFAGCVNDNVMGIKSAVDRLRESGWQGNHYDSFKANMEKEIAKITSCMAGIERVSKELKEKAKNYASIAEKLKKLGG